MRQHEAYEQQVIFQWAFLNRNRHPELKWQFFAVPNGGSRHKLEAANLKKQGVKAGVSDMLLLVSRGGYHGVALELKKPGGKKPSANQLNFLASMKKHGYYSKTAYGAEEAIKTIELYLNNKIIRSEDDGTKREGTKV